MPGQSLEEDSIYLTLSIPNKEIRSIYRSTIREWFDKKLKTVDFVPLHQALTQGDSEAFSAIIKKQLRDSISYYDTKEAFYYGFLTGLFSVFQDYELLSNRESGNGRPDLMLKPYDELNPAIIIEIKVTDQFTEMDRGCEIALKQIKDREYHTELIREGYRHILQYGICFCKKSCMVRKAEE